jgi:alpha-N-acetylglucosaminidase
MSTARKAAVAAMRRLARDFWDRHGERVTVDIGGEADSYEVAAADGAVTIRAGGAGCAVAAFRAYLETVRCGHFSRGGSWVKAPEDLPPLASPLSARSRRRVRYAYNPTVFGYTTPYWTWRTWERELDLLAASGINLAYLPIGVEAIWRDVLVGLGLDRESVLDWIALPGRLPWQLMGNLHGHGGMTDALVDARSRLGQRIAKRMRQLDIEPVLPGFAGYVPDGLAAHLADARVLPQGDWNGYDRPGWLDPTCGAFAAVASSYYDKQAELFGHRRHQSVDLLFEGGSGDDVSLPDATAAIAASMSRAHDDYVWVVQVWQDSPRPAMLDALDADHTLLLDLLGDTWPRPAVRTDVPWARGELSNFGGRPGLHGGLGDFADHPADTDPALVGTAFCSEATHTNPVVWSLFTDVAWHDEAIDLSAWLRDYVARRYGTANRHATRAWQGLLATVYRPRIDPSAATDSVLAAGPALDADRASPCAPRYLPYPPEALEVAWRDLLNARNECGHIDTYQYDLIDVTRQVVVNRARTLLPLLRTAYLSREPDRFDKLRTQFLDLFDLLDPALATRPEFLLAPWLATARALGTTAAESDALEHDARTLITTWGDPPAVSPVLYEYANREWSGLVSTYYRPRWAKYLDALSTALRDDTEPDLPDDATVWTDADPHPAAPEGDVVAVARAIHLGLPYFEGLP